MYNMILLSIGVQLKVCTVVCPREHTARSAKLQFSRIELSSSPIHSGRGNFIFCPVFTLMAVTCMFDLARKAGKSVIWSFVDLQDHFSGEPWSGRRSREHEGKKASDLVKRLTCGIQSYAKSFSYTFHYHWLSGTLRTCLVIIWKIDHLSLSAGPHIVHCICQMLCSK